jgi:hypothetical protein
MEQELSMAVKPITPKRTYFIVFLIIGCALGCTQLFAPIHELMHAFVATNNGIRAEVTGWSSTYMSTLNRPAIISGWAIQVVLFSFLALILALNSPRWTTGGFWYGLAIVHWIRAFGSSDFTNTLFSSFSNSGLSAYYPAYRTGLVTWWSIFGIMVFLFLGAVIYKRIRKAPG